MDMKLTTVDKPVKEKTDFSKIIESGDFFKIMDEAIQNSPTATMTVLMFKKYCVLPNLKKKYKAMWTKIVDEKIKYGMFTTWIKYDADLKPIDVSYRQSRYYRARKIDDLGNVNQYLNAKNDKTFPAFNPNKKVLLQQIEKAGGFKKFSGQVSQYNTTSQPYEITPLFSVYKWMLIEDDAPEHITASADNSLFGNNIFLMKKSAESSDQKDEATGEVKISNTDRVIGALRQAKSTKQSGTNHVLELGLDDDADLTKFFQKVDIGNNIDIDKFNAVDDKASKKICTAAYNFPPILANANEGVFGNSGDAINAAIENWKTTCLFEAEKINEYFKNIGIDLQEATEEEAKPVEDERTEEQKELMAFSGTVPNILALQASVQSGATTVESGVAMLKLLYGFKEDEARAIVGSPKITPPAQPQQ